jgi:hypothetical protein
MAALNIMPVWYTQFFDSPSAYRQFHGLIDFVNNYILRTASSSLIEINEQNVLILLNCNDEQIEKVRKNPIA